MEDSEPNLVKNRAIYYNVYEGFPMGMPFIPFVEGRPREDNGRNCCISQVDNAEAERFGRILAIAKNNNIWSNFWGDRVFTVNMVPTFKKDEDPELGARQPIYQKMVRDNGSLQLSKSHMIFPGLLDYNKKFVLRRSDANGHQKSWLQGR